MLDNISWRRRIDTCLQDRPRALQMTARQLRKVDWQVLADGRSKERKAKTRTANPEFIGYFHALVLSYQRKMEPAIDDLYRRWRRGDSIPGYDDIVNRRVLPAGWSRPNLRRLMPGKTELTLTDSRPASFTRAIGGPFGNGLDGKLGTYFYDEADSCTPEFDDACINRRHQIVNCGNPRPGHLPADARDAVMRTLFRLHFGTDLTP